jgi:polyferredoxin
MRIQRVIQGVSLSLFLLMLCLATFPLAEVYRLDLFLRMDPLVLVGTLISGRVLIPLLVPAVLVMALTPVLGRLFCSTICPLGTSIDISDSILGRLRGRLSGRAINLARLSSPKYFILAFILGSAVAGASLFLLFSPLSIATRLYGLLVYPLVAMGVGMGLPALREISDQA